MDCRYGNIQSILIRIWKQNLYKYVTITTIKELLLLYTKFTIISFIISSLTRQYLCSFIMKGVPSRCLLKVAPNSAFFFFNLLGLTYIQSRGTFIFLPLHSKMRSLSVIAIKESCPVHFNFSLPIWNRNIISQYKS